MKKIAKKVHVTTKTKVPKDTFADFFLRTPIAKQTEVLREVARKSNADQRDLMKQYDKTIRNTV